ncbi:MAG: transglutaminase domain-containing protein, partial [Oscillospiraceae bacterium]|nr:transglutaminase domain-containing protein [Oscillospiraceae bacterium]
EPLTAWREELAKHALPEDPQTLYQVLLSNITRTSENTYKNLVTTPVQAWNNRRCDGRSFRLLYVALLRTMGIPARLRTLDNEPEYYQNGRWIHADSVPTARLRLFSDTDAVYRQNWSLSRCDYCWSLLHLENETWTDGTLLLTLPEGHYRLQTVVRMPNGNQFAMHRDFMLYTGRENSIDLTFRSYEISDLLRSQRLPLMSAVTLDGKTVEDICRAGNRPTILFWLEEGGEPTEHILNELIAARDALQAADITVYFLLRSRDAIQQRTLALALEQLPFVRVLLDDWAYDLETAARHLTCDPDTPPLAVVCDADGNAVYGISGYSVGSVELILRIAKHLTK